MVTTRQKRLAIRGGELAVEEAPTPKRRRSTAAAPASPKKQQKQPAAPTSPTGVKKKKAPPEPATTKKKQKQQQEQKGGAAAASGAGGSGEAPAAASDHIAINRAPVLTLWVAVVAQRQGFSFDEGLTFGKTVSGWLAQSKGRKLGIFEKVGGGTRGECVGGGAAAFGCTSTNHCDTSPCRAGALRMLPCAHLTRTAGTRRRRRTRRSGRSGVRQRRRRAWSG